MAAYLSPIGNEQQSDSNGAPVSGALINTYLAGTTTPVVTYSDAAGVTPQANPIVCNSAGYPASPIYILGGQAIKMVFTTSVASGASAYRPAVDNIQGVNDPSYSSTVSEWQPFAAAPLFVSATSFSVTGDQTGTFQLGRRLKTTNSGGTVYSTISTSTYSAGPGTTTVVVVNDSGVLDGGLSAVSYALLSATSRSLPINAITIRGFTSGLVPSTAGASATMSFTAGQTADSTNAEVLTLNAAISKTTSAWSVGTAAGGLDTGAIANNTWYYFYLIKRVDTGVVDVVFSLSNTSPTSMPSGYTLRKQIFAGKTNGSAQWQLFTATETAGGGLDVVWSAGFTELNASVAASRTLSTPNGLPALVVKANVDINASSVGAGVAVKVGCPDEVDAAVTSTTTGTTLITQVAGQGNAVPKFIRTDSSGRIFSRATGTVTVVVQCNGFEMARR